MADAVEPELASAQANSIVSAPPDAGPRTLTSESRDTIDEPIFPPLQNNAGAETDSLLSSGTIGAPSRPGMGPGVGDDNDEDEPAVARPFHRTSSPDSGARSGPSMSGQDEDGEGATDGTAGSRFGHKMHKFSLYETASRFYIVGGDVTERRYRILKIDRTDDEDASELSITDDKTVYSQKDMNQLLDTIDDGNKHLGGLKLRCTTWGLLGFIKFTGPWYMLLITKKSTVALIGGHSVYQVDGTDLIPLTSRAFKTDQRNTEESRFLGILNNLDLTRSFYYSYSYDITHTLQYNITRERLALNNGQPCCVDDDFNSMFVWNNHLLQPARELLHKPYDWCRPIIHGYMDQSAVSIYGRTAHITIIARRSRYFAGARFLKRGANDLGYVANDVETEQIVSEALTTSFHAPGPKFFASPAYTSYVQHRGSIPLYWTQDNTGVTPKPMIELNLVDPFYTAAALHFDNLFERYGAPIYVLNLVKARERTPRESKLLEEYGRAIEYLNQFLPAGKTIIHHAWDMSRAAKSPNEDVIATLEIIGEKVVQTTGFFHNGDGHTSPIRTQDGVVRTNCIDCLDRTNAAQFVIGKRALGHQLHALGILEDTVVNYDTDAVNLFTHMYHDHGDTIAVQYGGSQLVNTMETYRKINQWTSHSRDMIESFKRYYNNSFLDGQRQEAYNLFLGNYIFSQGQPMLWDLATDYYLHHEDPRMWLDEKRRKRNYINWFTPKHLQPRVLEPYPPMKRDSRKMQVSVVDDYWLEYYRPSTLSSLVKMFPYKMNSTIKYIPFKTAQEGRWDLSPFRVRTTEGLQHTHTVDSQQQEQQQEPAEQKNNNKGRKKEVTIVAPHDDMPHLSGRGGISWLLQSYPSSRDRDTCTTNGNGNNTNNGQGQGQDQQQPQSIMKEQQQQQQQTTVEEKGGGGGGGGGYGEKQSALEKSRAAQWTFTKVVHESLNPTVSAAEQEDYARYVSHPHNLPLVVSSEIPAMSEIDAEYIEYVHGSWQTEGLHTTTTTVGGSSSSSAGEDDSNRAMYQEHMQIGTNQNPLTVTEEDAQKKRYKAYRKWLRGKSLFKQQPVD
ncbi:Polyphosphoinositide phosphatase [Diplogelasinospora grovesii]|uniref:Polyphosphoinositide phosphatase n=1 Tax=Diplogelasinospora grovesii TaxID=303347 RepID=A0AAN6NGR2_9PEZI|nr:Polyphosphoinositide phosphatase [Diplogelasinospora grovesii]